jgi:hypothetical protein
LKANDSNNVENLLEPESADLTEATYSKELSASDMDKMQNAFWTTFDRVLFHKPVDMICKVLEVNGYVVNFENIIACLDTMAFGVRGKVAEEGHKKKISEFVHCLQFGMPSKHQKMGRLLTEFYQEIQSYEAEVSRIQKESEGSGSNEKQLRDMRNEIAKLRQENQTLSDQVSRLSTELSDLEKAKVSLSRVVESQHMLPGDLRIAKVKGVRFRERLVTLRIGRKTLDAPMNCLPEFPEEEASCVVLFAESQVKDMFFYEGKTTPLEVRLANVLYKKRNLLKIRDSARQVWVIDAKFPEELEDVKTLRRGERVLLYLHDGKVVKFVPCARSDSTIFRQLALESITKAEIINLFDHVPSKPVRKVKGVAV